MPQKASVLSMWLPWAPCTILCHPVTWHWALLFYQLIQADKQLGHIFIHPISRIFFPVGKETSKRHSTQSVSVSASVFVSLTLSYAGKSLEALKGFAFGRVAQALGVLYKKLSIPKKCVGVCSRRHCIITGCVLGNTVLASQMHVGEAVYPYSSGSPWQRARFHGIWNKLKPTGLKVDLTLDPGLICTWTLINM